MPQIYDMGPAALLPLRRTAYGYTDNNKYTRENIKPTKDKAKTVKTLICNI
jgi:hypothetical protein